ncbi:SCL-interrupting locus protein [Ambystoma mexicanum]|uniref:SCL-interrupting locus protein n=1 Tax=Ambystoma mexicanum TaxID=8296 RepID=UPI0037E8B547
MSIPINVKNLPPHIIEATLNGMESNSNTRSLMKKAPFGFPSSKSALWDPTPMGDTIGLHLGYYRNPKLLVMEKVVRLVYLHAKSERKPITTCFLLGSLSVDDDEEGIILTLDRFDPGRDATGGGGKVATVVSPGDFIIPCTVKTSNTSTGETSWLTSEDYSTTFKSLQNHLCNKDCLDLSKLLSVRALIVYTENMDNLNFDLHWVAVTVANVCESIPVKPVSVIPTALARNLSSSINLSQVQGRHKCGYLTMDQTRKLLLVLESDPKVYNLPLVGIWLSGVIHIHSPLVWASCLRFMFSSTLQQRVLSEKGAFLIVLYSLTHKEPEFYECLPCSGTEELQFQVLNSSESLHLFKTADPSYKRTIQCELSAATLNADIDFINGISKDVSISSLNQRPSPSKLSASDHDSGVEDDVSPRPTPSPHPASQQVSRIHPSVPELSIVFDGSFVESKTRPKHLMNVNHFTPPTQPSLPARSNCPQGIVYKQNRQHCSPEQQNFSPPHKEHSLRRLSNPLSQELPAVKRPTSWKGSQTRKSTRSSSSSSSSSPSTPQSGVSPDTSILKPKKQSLHPGPASGTVPPSGPPPVRRAASSHCRPPAFSPVSLQHITQQDSQRLAEIQMPVSPSPCTSPINTCSCSHLNGHIQYCPSNMWQGVGNICSSSSTTGHSEVPAECSYSVLPSNMSFPNTCCSPVCIKRENCCSNSNLMSPRRMHSSKAVPCNSCAAHSACTQASLPPVLDNGMMGLSVDAYRLLAEQDRQLKLLQAQIQRLLEAQALQSSSNNTQSQRQVEFIAMETQSTAGLQLTKSVSIAVSTGASLFWNSPCDGQEESVSQAKQNDADNLDDLTISVNPEDNTSHTSISSSLRAVDICSFAESTQDPDDEPSQSSDSLSVSQHIPNRQHPSTFPAHPPSDELNLCLGTEPTGVHNCMEPTNNIQDPIQNVARLPADHIFYQDLLGQVNHLLRSSSECEEPSVKVNQSDENQVSESSTKTRKKSSQADQTVNDQDDVLRATMKQLKQLGVNMNMDSSDTLKKKANKVENASVLASINPEAVIPRLNYLSLANVGMSGISPNGVDLSMEANAIALKYLNESQLSQLSQSRTSQSNPLDYSVFQSFLNANMEKSMVGLSLISPNNMSFATKKYMKRYGLIPSSDNSDEEEEPGEARGDCDDSLYITSRPIPEGLSCRKGQGNERMKTNEDSYHPGTPTSHFLHKADVDTLNVTEEIAPKMVLQPADPNSRQPLKESDLNSKRLASKAQFTRHPEKENAKEIQFFPDKLHKNSFDLKHSENQKTVGDFLDVSRLRKLPKLF